MNHRCLVLLASACTTALASCGQISVRAVPGGDASAGRDAIVNYECGACHTIPGVPGAHTRVGPPLGGFAGRAIIAGKLPNTPDNLTLWIEHPQQVVPGVDMPDVGVDLSDARNIAAYLYTLQ